MYSAKSAGDKVEVTVLRGGDRRIRVAPTEGVVREDGLVPLQRILDGDARRLVRDLHRGQLDGAAGCVAGVRRELGVSRLADKSWFSPRALRHSGIPSVEEQTLTKREIQILEQLVRDRSADEIAASLGISKSQVENFLKLLMKKYEADSLRKLKDIAQRVLSRRNS